MEYLVKAGDFGVQFEVEDKLRDFLHPQQVLRVAMQALICIYDAAESGVFVQE